MWGETFNVIGNIAGSSISTHSPRVGRDAVRLAHWIVAQVISTHSPRVGRDCNLCYCPLAIGNFNPLSPCGERRDRCFDSSHDADFNPLSPCGERRVQAGCKVKFTGISTHSPRVGRDISKDTWCYYVYDFNPLSPCGERPKDCFIWFIFLRFQPTLPVWGETYFVYLFYIINIISTHSPRVGRDNMDIVRRSDLVLISTHSPRVGRDRITLTSRYCIA